MNAFLQRLRSILRRCVNLWGAKLEKEQGSVLRIAFNQFQRERAMSSLRESEIESESDGTGRRMKFCEPAAKPIVDDQKMSEAE